MTKEEAVVLLCEHFSEGLVRTIVDAIAEDELVAWGMKGEDGSILDVICPEAHDREEGSYTIPLYTHPKLKGEYE
jgi:hypothetical protein